MSLVWAESCSKVGAPVCPAVTEWGLPVSFVWAVIRASWLLDSVTRASKFALTSSASATVPLTNS